MNAAAWGRKHAESLYRWGTLLVALVPPLFVASMFLGAPSFVPPGTDPAHHAVLANEMLRTQRAVALYSEFPANGAMFEYPSLFNLATALIMATTGVGVFAAMEALVTALSFASVLSYSLFLRKFFNGSPRDTFVATATVALSWFVLMRTVRDGAYGEVLGAGVLLPLWLTFLWTQRPVLAPATFFAILITHNLSALLAGAVLVAYLVTFGLMRNWRRTLRAFGGHLAMLAITIVPFWSVYASYVTPFTSGIAGSFPVFGLSGYPILLTPLLLFGGIAGALVVVKSPRNRFVAIWLAFFLLLAQSGLSSERIVREASFPLAIGLALLGFRLEPLVLRSGARKTRVLGAVVVAGVVVSAAFVGLPSFAANADPSAQYYLQENQIQAYAWLQDHLRPGDAVLTIYVADPYLGALVTAPVYPVVSTNYSATLSAPDRALNTVLLSGLLNFSRPASFAALRSIGIRWIVLSTAAPYPIWTLPSELPLIHQALRLAFAYSANYSEAGSWVGGGGYTRIIELIPGG